MIIIYYIELKIQLHVRGLMMQNAYFIHNNNLVVIVILIVFYDKNFIWIVKLVYM